MATSPVLQFAIPAKSRKAGREPGSIHRPHVVGLARNDGFGNMLHGLQGEKGFFRSSVNKRFHNSKLSFGLPPFRRVPSFEILSSILYQLPAEFLCTMPFLQLTTDNGLLTSYY